MTQLHDQFSAVRKAQFEAQFDFFNAFTTQAIENASRLAALNLAVSRDAVQRSLGAGFALMNSRDPRDVLTLGGQAEEGMRSLFAYGRELIGIAGGVRPYAVRLPVQAPRQAVETVEHASVAAIEAAPAAATVGDVAQAAAEAVVMAAPEAAPQPPAAEPVPVAEPKAIAKAAGKGTAAAAAVPHPAAAPMAVADEVEVPKLDLPKADLPKIEIAPVPHSGGNKRRK